MLRFMPAGWIGLMLGGLVAANSSTILTHLNWGASYLVHDFYRRFLRRDASESHYVLAGRIVTVLLMLAGIGFDAKRAIAEMNGCHGVMNEARADMLGLRLHLLHEPRALNRIGEARIVLDFGGDGELSA